jgi:hypothetical protein
VRIVKDAHTPARTAGQRRCSRYCGSYRHRRKGEALLVGAEEPHRLETAARVKQQQLSDRQAGSQPRIRGRTNIVELVPTVLERVEGRHHAGDRFASEAALERASAMAT